jgi:hypothetical protein
MKKLFSLFLALAFCSALTATAHAAAFGNAVPFVNMSAASAAVKTSSVYSVRGFGTKTLNVSGVTLGSSPSDITFKNMSGTVLAQCAPTSTGPWSTCIANDYAQTAASRTTNGAFTWSDATAYVRLHWTSGTIGGKLKAWLNWQE